MKELEQALLRAPFDHGLRQTYVQALLEQARAPDAQAQAELLCQQQPGDARGWVLQALCQLRQNRHEQAMSDYERARSLTGFEPEQELEHLAAQALPRESATPKLQLVAAASARVQAIQQVAEDKLRFSSIVGMEALKKTIRLKIIEPFLNPGLFQRFRMGSGGGILLYGPPGCGKTMLARAVANECKAGFISVGIADVLAMWMGESERNLAAMFERARRDAPCVLFFDELDALAYARSKAAASSARTVVNEFLSQLDGLGRDNKGVLVLAATNMPWDVDDAMKRPGRFSRQVFVAPPDAAARAEMLRIKLLGVPADALDLQALAARAEHYSGADIDGLIELAKESALADGLEGRERGLNMTDFELAFSSQQPSTLEWLRTVRNVVRYAGEDGSFKEVESYLKKAKLL
ncbi:ATP-binding protein [Paucibacter sp. XJ19-41]|uniref:ATP-binding protein n=1 Tax=Paucibacter sp. XJ19-41 TaxID=2927824 RepID=UPI0023495309|nr:AAA family ATPase [Paucibacter sp. XJ19-41]MDC6168668.1 AAA family ATPase [Paucibacter sp. XJ19-41]